MECAPTEGRVVMHDDRAAVIYLSPSARSKSSAAKFVRKDLHSIMSVLNVTSAGGLYDRAIVVVQFHHTFVEFKALEDNARICLPY